MPTMSDRGDPDWEGITKEHLVQIDAYLDDLKPYSTTLDDPAQEAEGREQLATHSRNVDAAETRRLRAAVLAKYRREAAKLKAKSGFLPE
jgi:hypothetical protein